MSPQTSRHVTPPLCQQGSSTSTGFTFSLVACMWTQHSTRHPALSLVWLMHFGVGRIDWKSSRKICLWTGQREEPGGLDHPPCKRMPFLFLYNRALFTRLRVGFFWGREAGAISPLGIILAGRFSFKGGFWLWISSWSLKLCKRNENFKGLCSSYLFFCCCFLACPLYCLFFFLIVLFSFFIYLCSFYEYYDKYFWMKKILKWIYF